MVSFTVLQYVIYSYYEASAKLGGDKHDCVVLTVLLRPIAIPPTAIGDNGIIIFAA